MKVYLYKLTVDDGGAPCVENDLLSLAICKPMIRSTADVGDFLFGFAARSLFDDNRLIYVAKVTQKVEGEYYRDRRYSRRSDCIYQLRGRHFEWRPRALYHGQHHLKQDLGKYPAYARANVLLSTNFRYFGTNGSVEYKTKYPAIRCEVEELGQGHRVNHDEILRRELLYLADDAFKSTQRKVTGQSSSGPRRGVSHRGTGCRVVLPEAC
jgi:Nucleotide modification associated domain 2